MGQMVPGSLPFLTGPSSRCWLGGVHMNIIILDRTDWSTQENLGQPLLVKDGKWRVTKRGALRESLMGSCAGNATDILR